MSVQHDLHSSTQVQAGISRLKQAQAGAYAFPVARKFRSSDLMQERFYFFLHHFISTNAGKLFCLFPHRLAPLQRSKRDLIQHFTQDPVMWEPHGCGQSRHHLPPVTWMAMQCVRRHENVGRSGGGEACGTGSRQYVKDKSYKYARTPCSSAPHISYHHRDLEDQSYHLSSWLSSAGCSYSPIA